MQLWLSTDPLAEKFPNASPYNYCLNNPLIFVDPDGKAPNPPKWLKNFWREVKDWFTDKPKMKVSIEVGKATWEFLPEVLDMVASTKIEVKASFGLQASLEGEVFNRKGGADLNIASLTIARGSYEQQETDYGPQKFDGFLLYGENEKGQNFVEVNQSLSGGVGLISGGFSREFKGKANRYEDLKDEKSIAIGPVSSSMTQNEKGQITDKKINVARGKIALGLGIEIKFSVGSTTDKIRE
ncbi:hypothetical protein FLACOL_00128 [Flavobacterium columnare]|uniref:RHS repeat-associated core domain-containing protein n=1 Tax=Flavobacterium columnare TaxID=996 RepID=A0A2N9P721_9FLAO|nr:hypothetical protein FLACOL_00128 [Flavobacterium columnare]